MRENTPQRKLKVPAKNIQSFKDPPDILPHKIDKLNALKYSIKSQMRVLGGQDYIEQVHNILHRQQEEVKSFIYGLPKCKHKQHGDT